MFANPRLLGTTTLRVNIVRTLRGPPSQLAVLSAIVEISLPRHCHLFGDVARMKIGGANFGGGQMTHALAASEDFPLSLRVTVAVTGPSETSSCHPSLFAKVVIGAFAGDAEEPKPPRTTKRPAVSVRISQSGTTTPRKLPVSNAADLFRPLNDRGPGSMIRLLRFATAAFLFGAFGFRPSNSFQAAFVFARCTVQEMLASLAVTSPTNFPPLS